MLTVPALFSCMLLLHCSYDGAVRLLGTFEDEKYIYLVQEICQKVRGVGGEGGREGGRGAARRGDKGRRVMAGVSYTVWGVQDWPLQGHSRSLVPQTP
jgi:hypothetical protein